MIPAAPTPDVNDFGQINGLRLQARQRDPQALRGAARQFEALLIQQILKSANAAKLGDDLTGGQQGEIYQDMFNQQMAQQLSKGHGLGLADMLVRQLQGSQQSPAPAAKPAAFPISVPTFSHAPSVSTSASASTPASTSASASASVANTPSAGAADAGSPVDFVSQLMPQAQQAAKELGVPARVLVAQAALETGWGRHVIRNADGTPSYNFFGIKAGGSWQGASVSKTTHEYGADGGGPHAVSAEFRSYATPQAAFSDYVNFLKSNPRYRQALAHGGDPSRFVSGLQQAGYASDPDYASKIRRIANGPSMNVALASLSGHGAKQEIA